MWPGVVINVWGGSNTENFQISVAGHNMTLLSLDGAYDVQPIQVQRFNLHLGERVELDVDRARVGGDRAAREGLAQVELSCLGVPVAAQEADDLRREQMRVEIHHREHQRIDGHAKRLRAGQARARRVGAERVAPHHVERLVLVIGRKVVAVRHASLPTRRAPHLAIEAERQAGLQQQGGRWPHLGAR